jgi:hypothetical protein
VEGWREGNICGGRKAPGRGGKGDAPCAAGRAKGKVPAVGHLAAGADSQGSAAGPLSEGAPQPRARTGDTGGRNTKPLTKEDSGGKEGERPDPTPGPYTTTLPKSSGMSKMGQYNHREGPHYTPGREGRGLGDRNQLRGRIGGEGGGLSKVREGRERRNSPNCGRGQREGRGWGPWRGSGGGGGAGGRNGI